jgi:hypothetical protein
MLLPGSAAVLSVMLAAYFIAGVSFARDERRAEQVLGDDDPITLPTSAVPEAANRIWQLLRDLDPETTGSVSTPWPNVTACRSRGFLIVHPRISFGQNVKADGDTSESVEQAR